MLTKTNSIKIWHYAGELKMTEIYDVVDIDVYEGLFSVMYREDGKNKEFAVPIPKLGYYESVGEW